MTIHFFGINHNNDQINSNKQNTHNLIKTVVMARIVILPDTTSTV